DLAEHVEEDGGGDDEADEAPEPGLGERPGGVETAAVTGVDLQDFVGGAEAARGQDFQAPAAEQRADAAAHAGQEAEEEVEEFEGEAGDQPGNGGEKNREKDPDNGLGGVTLNQIACLLCVGGGDDPEDDPGYQDGYESGDRCVRGMFEAEAAAA